MSIILPNLNHSFVPVPVPFPDSGSVSGFQISEFSIRPIGRYFTITVQTYTTNDQRIVLKWLLVLPNSRL